MADWRVYSQAVTAYNHYTYFFCAEKAGDVLLSGANSIVRMMEGPLYDGGINNPIDGTKCAWNYSMMWGKRA